MQALNAKQIGNANKGARMVPHINVNASACREWVVFEYFHLSNGAMHMKMWLKSQSVGQSEAPQRARGFGSSRQLAASTVDAAMQCQCGSIWQRHSSC
jgi:hypothetical protein